jgi:hypothetical protein
MHDHASELRRIPIPRTSMNKGKRKGRGCYTPALRTTPGEHFCELYSSTLKNHRIC